MSWTDQRVEKLEKLWKEGKSAAEIAKELGDVTRNAVIGKAHRLGLSGRPQSSASTQTKKDTSGKTAKSISPKKVAEAKKQASAKAVAETQAKTVPAAVVRSAATRAAERPEDGLTILDLSERVCKWPIGDPRDADFHFCGGPSRPGTPYCDEHVAMAYQTSSGRRQESKQRNSAAA